MCAVSTQPWLYNLDINEEDQCDLFQTIMAFVLMLKRREGIKGMRKMGVPVHATGYRAEMG